MKSYTRRKDRGWFRRYTVDGKPVGYVGFSFFPNNSGGFFARNYGNGSAHVTVYAPDIDLGNGKLAKGPTPRPRHPSGPLAKRFPVASLALRRGSDCAGNPYAMGRSGAVIY